MNKEQKLVEQVNHFDKNEKMQKLVETVKIEF